jgi:hypothetical protein
MYTPSKSYFAHVVVVAFTGKVAKVNLETI